MFKVNSKFLNEIGINVTDAFLISTKVKIPYKNAPIEIQTTFTEEQYNALGIAGNNFVDIPSINEQVEHYIKINNIKDKGFVALAYYVKDNQLEKMAVDVEYVNEDDTSLVPFNPDDNWLERVANVHKKEGYSAALEFAVNYAYTVGLSHGGMDSSLFKKALKANLE